MSRSRKDNTMLGAMGVLVVFAAFNFLIRPQGAELSSLQDDRAAVEQRVSEAELLLLAPVDTPTSQPGSDLDSLAGAVPVDPEIATLLRQLQAVATETGMLHSSISPLPPELSPSGVGGSLQLTISATGSHESAMEYVKRLRDLERLAVIERIGLTLQADGSEQLEIAVRVFSQQI